MKGFSGMLIRALQGTMLKTALGKITRGDAIQRLISAGASAKKLWNQFEPETKGE